MKKLLMVAFHFPPASGTSGVQRALRFSSHLPEFGWTPIVLTVTPRAYEKKSCDLLGQISAQTTVIRAPAWDAKRHFSIAGRYPTAFALPDRWSSWYPGGVVAGLAAIQKFKPDAIWSTYPLATAHRIAATLSSRSRIPLVADFRDPMAQTGYPADPRTWRSFDKVEKRVINVASYCTFTTPGAVTMYKQRYHAKSSQFKLLENGYDERTFVRTGPSKGVLNEGKRTLLHSGIVYPSERDPEALFLALRELRRIEPRCFERLVIRFRAPVHENLLLEMSRKYDVEVAIEVLPSVSYEDAIMEMQRADGLLILQASNCNAQIPAKYYEYLRAGPPIVLITDPKGDTAKTARSSGVRRTAKFGSPADILGILRDFVLGNVTDLLPDRDAVVAATREARTKSLAILLDQTNE